MDLRKINFWPKCKHFFSEAFAKKCYFFVSIWRNWHPKLSLWMKNDNITIIPMSTININSKAEYPSAQKGVVYYKLLKPSKTITRNYYCQQSVQVNWKLKLSEYAKKNTTKWFFNMTTLSHMLLDLLRKR